MQRSGLKTSPRRHRSLSSPSWGLRRIFLVSGLFLVGIAGLYILSVTGSFTAGTMWIQKRLITLSAHMGYRVDKVDVDGRIHLPINDLKSKVNIDRGTPLFSIDLQTLRHNLMQDPWIKDVSISRQVPDRIYILITERRPIALWQKTGKVRVIDADGIPLTSDLRGFSTLPLVVGDGAERTAAALLSEITAEPAIFQKMEAASWIGQRRWDIILKNKMVIKLPEEDMGLALRRLADGDRSDQILTKHISEIDLRQPDRMIMTPKAGKSHDFIPSSLPDKGIAP